MDTSHPVSVESPPEPVAVIETGQGFQAVWADDRVRIEVEGEGSRLSGTGLSTSGWVRTLSDAVASYRGVRPALAKAGPPRRPRERARRFVRLELFMPDGIIYHTFADAVRLVQELAGRKQSEGTILYIMGWNGHYDTGYPIYEPAEQLGGGDGLDRLVKLGQDHGLTVMPHVNFWGYDAKTGVIPNYQEFQLRDADGDLMCYPGGGRWVAETNRLEYMRVDDPRWQEVWFRYIDGLVTRFGLQALYLDQIGTVPDEGTRSGSLQMVERLNASYPQMLLCMELLAEFLTPYIDLHSSWGAPWCGLKFIDDPFPGAFSPITRLLYGDRVIFVQHPGGVAAVPSRQVWTNFPYLVEHGQVGTFARCQELDRLLGAIPCVYLAYNTYGIDPLSSMVLSMA